MSNKISKDNSQDTNPLLLSGGSDSSDSKNENLIKIFKFVNALAPETILGKYDPNDLGFGKLFSDTYSKILKFVSDAGVWRYYDGARWVNDTSETFIDHCARLLVNYLKSKDNEGLARYVCQLSKLGVRKTMIKDARSINPVVMTSFDSDPLHLER